MGFLGKLTHPCVCLFFCSKKSPVYALLPLGADIQSKENYLFFFSVLSFYPELLLRGHSCGHALSFLRDSHKQSLESLLSSCLAFLIPPFLMCTAWMRPWLFALFWPSVEP